MYETNRTIEPLSEIRKREEEQAQIEKNAEARKILDRVLKYYNSNYPKSEKGYKWEKPKITLTLSNESLHEFLDRLTEKELRGVYDIFDYYSKEVGLTIVKDFEKKRYILGLINKIIPGGQYYEKVLKLEEEQRIRQEELDQYRKRLEKDRAEFQKKFIKIPEVVKEEDKEEQFICRICGKICGNGGGLSSHMKTHEG